MGWPELLHVLADRVDDGADGLGGAGDLGGQVAADLAALPQTGMTKDFQCVTGWRVADVPWSGVLLRDVLAVAGVVHG